jgi:predicted CopG family antitoxin
MPKKLTITVSDDVYEGLHRRVGRRHISHFVEEAVRPHLAEKPIVFTGSLAEAYREMAADEKAERDAGEWIEGGPNESLPDEDFRGWPGYPSR